MYHPAAALRAGEIMKQLKADFQVIPEALKKIPEPQLKPEQLSLV